MAAAIESQANRVSDGVFMAGLGRQVTTAGRAAAAPRRTNARRARRTRLSDEELGSLAETGVIQ